MYATCIHCARRLGANESIEALPVGSRLAFDAARGRLWVVCRACERWNLTPFDARWEALEQCEKAFRDTRVRVSTDEIGMARLRDGTDLIRIGAPQRPEFAAWRYGDQFGRRRTRNLMIVGGSVAGVGLAASGLIAAGAGAAVLLPLIQLASTARLLTMNPSRNMTTLQNADGTWIAPFGTPRIIEMPEVTERWGVDVGIWAKGDSLAAITPQTFFERKKAGQTEIGRAKIPGHLAVPLLRRVLSQINRGGATSGLVQDGVRLIEEAGGPERFALWATGMRREWAKRSQFGDPGELHYIPRPARLAFEMALHEDSERRALEGELATLTDAWREAEEIAAIADGLAIPSPVERAFERLRGRVTGGR